LDVSQEIVAFESKMKLLMNQIEIGKKALLRHWTHLWKKNKKTNLIYFTATFFKSFLSALLRPCAASFGTRLPLKLVNANNKWTNNVI